MRYLHVIQPHEVFVARGEYRYERSGEPTAVREQWTIHELEGGAQFFRVDEDGREEDGLTILSEALLSPEHTFERFNVQSFNPQDDDLQQFKADYSFNPDYVQIGRQVESEERVYSEFDLRDGTVIYIKQTIFMGYTIRQILAAGGGAHVFTPQLLSTTDSHLLKMIVEPRAEETLTIGTREIATEKFQVADDIFYWLDEYDIPVKRQYTYDDVKYTCTLTDYAHRP